MNAKNDSNLEAVLESIEEKLKTLEDHRKDLHNQIAVKRAKIQSLSQAIELLHEMESN